MKHKDRFEVLDLIQRQGPISLDDIENQSWSMSPDEVGTYLNELEDDELIKETDTFTYDTTEKGDNWPDIDDDLEADPSDDWRENEVKE